jgi:hypothetical protein
MSHIKASLRLHGSAEKVSHQDFCNLEVSTTPIIPLGLVGEYTIQALYLSLYVAIT